MKSQLAELGALLDMQIPVLFSFVVLRWTAVRAFHGCLRTFVPRRLAPACALAGKWARQARTTFLMTGMFALAYWSFMLPPTDICAEYSSVRVQGINALVALAVLSTCNGLTASAFALSALKAVAGTSSAALLLSPSAVVSATGTGSLLYFATTFSLAVIYASMCHDHKHGERTHGAILSIIYTLLYCSAAAAATLWMRIWRVARRAVERASCGGFSARPDKLLDRLLAPAQPPAEAAEPTREDDPEAYPSAQEARPSPLARRRPRPTHPTHPTQS